MAQNDTRVPSYFVYFGYLLMLAGLVARDILFLRCLLLGAQILVALYAVSIAVPAITAWTWCLPPSTSSGSAVSCVSAGRRTCRSSGNQRPVFGGGLVA